jgi:large subunit ribosomal protein L9
MRVVLLQEVRSLGGPGEVIEVADGYARNYLIPRRLAARATKGALKQVETLRRTRELKEVRDREKAAELAAQLGALRVRVPAKAGETGRLFGQVTPQAVADAIVAAGGPRIDRKRLHFEGPIKSLGVHRASLRLHPEVEAELTIEVVRA